MIPNPFTPGPGQSPRVLAGRDRERTRMRDLLGRVSTFGEYAGPLFTLLGPRGLGKTVLLKDIQRDAIEAGFVSVWVPVSRGTSLIDELRAQIERALSNADSVPSSALDRFRASSRTLGAEVSAHLGPIGGKISRSTTRRERVLPRAPISALVGLLGTAADLVSKPGGAGLVVFLDELHASDEGDLAVLLNAIQALEGQPHRIAVFAAGLPTTPGLLAKAATFGERTTFVELHRLTPQAATEALVAPARSLEVKWDPKAIDVLVRASSGLPYLVQLLGSSVWDSVRPEAGQIITANQTLVGCEDAISQVMSMFRARWEAASPSERDFLAAMARHPEPVARSLIASELGKSTQALGVPRDRLIDKNVIESAEYGKLRFVLPAFGAFVLSQVEDAAPDVAETLFGDLPARGDGDQPPWLP